MSPIKKKILVVLGGNSREREISLITGEACYKSLIKLGYKVDKFDPKKKQLNLINKENWKFSYSPDTIHYFIMIATKGKFSINKAKNSIADFNMSNFSDLRLKVSNSFLNTSDQMIMVKFFNDSKKALDYYLSFKVNKGIVKNYKEENFFVISPDNLRELYLEKNPDNYVKFFEEFYQ